MTHTLHRQGCVQALQGDYVVFVFAEEEESVPGVLATQKARLRERFPGGYAILRFLKHVVVRIVRATGIREPEQEPREEQTGLFVLHSREELLNCVEMLKKADTGRSVVVSGLVDQVGSCLKELGLSPHTVQLSLGYFGKTELLPSEEILEITTMCGHHMVSPRLVERLAADIGKGRITSEEAAEAMAKLCTCGVFNEVRAAKIIEASSMK
jgi:hypothetical protein